MDGTAVCLVYSHSGTHDKCLEIVTKLYIIYCLYIQYVYLVNLVQFVSGMIWCYKYDFVFNIFRFTCQRYMYIHISRIKCDWCEQWSQYTPKLFLWQSNPHFDNKIIFILFDFVLLLYSITKLGPMSRYFSFLVIWHILLTVLEVQSDPEKYSFGKMPAFMSIFHPGGIYR